MGQYKEISVTDVQRLNEESGGLTLIDVRTVEEFEEVHAAIAKSLPLSSFQAERVLEMGFRPDDSVFVICRSGVRSASACEILSKAGFDQVFNISGGTNEWEASGLPVVRSKKGAS